MKKNERNIKEYIERCIKDACATENCENDVEYIYRIIEDQFIFAISSKYKKVRNRIEYRLLHNLKKNFGYAFNLVYPNPYREFTECWKSGVFSIYEISNIDPNHAIDIFELWNGKKFILCSMYGNRPYEELGENHINKLIENGFSYYNNPSWDNFVSSYRAAYDMTPMEGFLLARKEYERRVEAERQHSFNEAAHGCGYWSICEERGAGCPCSPNSAVSKGFNFDVWNRMSERFSMMMSSDDYDEYGEYPSED